MVAFMAVSIPMVNNILSQDKEFVLANLKLYTVAFLGMFSVLSGLMLLFSYIFRSLLNPHSSNAQHEQRTGKNSTRS